MNDSARGRVLVCFAVPDESRLFTQGLENRRVVRGDGRHPLPTVFGHIGSRSVVVAHTGIGDSAKAREHVERRLAETIPSPEVVISAGYAGALHPKLLVGDLILGENHSSPTLLEKARPSLTADGILTGVLLTEPAAAETASHKRALYDATGALAVDMETAWIAQACATAGVPMLSLRVISDASDQDFPVPGRVLYDAVRQRPRYLALPAWLAMHPAQIAPFVRFVRGLGPARQRLTRALQTMLAHL